MHLRHEREANGRVSITTFCRVDMEALKTTDTIEKKGRNSNKKMHSKIQRLLTKGMNGLPHTIETRRPDAHDRNSAFLMFFLHEDMFSEVAGVLIDGAL